MKNIDFENPRVRKWRLKHGLPEDEETGADYVMAPDGTYVPLSQENRLFALKEQRDLARAMQD